jgi:single-stranded-DNA-specific exonuclease
MVSAQTAPQQWTIRKAAAATDAQHLAQDLAQQIGCPQVIAELLAARGIVEPAAANAFFHPSIDDLPDPLQMLGMAVAVARIQRAVGDAEPILIYGDYDVDGTTATVLLKTAIERIAPRDKPAKVTYHVPHRLREGYGMQTGILGEAATAGIRLVISVDTGIRAFEAATEAKALGLDLIVTDHHLPDDVEGMPEAVAVLNPAQPGCAYPFKSLCGAGVAFKLAHALLLAAAETADDPEAQRTRLKRGLLPSFLKLVAIATIADSVPLQGENRIIAALGLQALCNPVQPGLRALMQLAQIPANRAPTATEVGFRLAPRINAAGRMDIAGDVVELFLTRDTGRADALAKKLDRLNDERRDTERMALEVIDLQLDALRDSAGEFTADCIIVDDPAWHRGVLGILASRIVDRTGRPALVLTHENGHAHGSGRSIEGFHLLDALTAVHDASRNTDADGTAIGLPEGLFTRFGGHAHAVGFSLPTAQVELLRSRMQRYGAPLLIGPMLAPPLEYDAEVELRDLTQDLSDWLVRCGPFGIGNREPVLMTRNLTLAASVRFIKEKHICLHVQKDGEPSRFTALGWSRGIDWPARCADLGLQKGSRIDIVYWLRTKSNPQFPGLELQLIDLRLAASL